MSKIKKQYTEEQIVEAVKSSKSIAEVLRRINLKPFGSNYITLKRKIAHLNLDTSHFTGELWSKNQSIKQVQEYKCTSALKKCLLKQRGHQCESCKLTEWLNLPITIELDHIDGNNFNNDINNLRLLCPNCHSQTSTWRGRKNKLGAPGQTRTDTPSGEEV